MSKRKLLLADDSVTIQKVVNLTFADEGIEVTAVGDGNTAMEKFVENVPDLVMVDVNMPGLDGYKICEIIKQDEETAHIPVILLVGSFEPFDEEEARRVGADDYLTKPFQSIRQLVGKVTFLLESNNKAVSNEEHFPAANETAETSSSSGDDKETQDVSNIGESSSDVEEVNAAAQFDDSETDDETIQTNQIGSLPVDESQKFSSDFSAENSSQISVGKSFENSYEYEPEETDWSKTSPFTGVDELGGQQSEKNAADEKADEFAGGASSDAISNADEDIFAQAATGGEKQRNAVTATGGDFLLLELDEMNLLELLFDEDESFDFPAETPDETEEEKEDLSAIEETQPEEQTAVAPILQSSEETGENVTAETPAVAETATESSFESADFPPEVIDAIAAKVVEKLSDKAIREIAWEVVPPMADLIIQKMAKQRITDNG